MKYSYILSLYVLTFAYSLSSDQTFQELLPHKSLAITQKILQSELTSEQNVLLLNFFYHMNRYCMCDLLSKQKSFILLQMTRDMHNYTAPNNDLLALLAKVKTTTIQLEDLFKSTKKHFDIWQALDKEIIENEPSMSDILTLTQDIGQELIESYLIETKSSINKVLLDRKQLLESGAQTNYTIARTLGLLVNEPELFYSDKKLENAQKLNIIHALFKHLEAHTHDLSTTKHILSVYVQSLQEVTAQFTALIYNALYAQIKIHNPEKLIQIMDITENNSLVCTLQVLPEKLLK